VTSADQYRAKAREFTEMASREKNQRLQIEYGGMAEAYFRLALLAERNQKTDIVYEPPSDQSGETA
jgi:hypothetical protein